MADTLVRVVAEPELTAAQALPLALKLTALALAIGGTALRRGEHARV
jgi:hypothetical protein